MNKFFLELNQRLKQLIVVKNYFTKNIMQELELKFPTLTIISRCVFQNGKKLYPQIYLDKYLYELQKLLQKELTLP